MKLESEEYPYCQLNETTNMSPSGQILSRSLMINLRNESPKQVWRAYKELKSLIDGKEEGKKTKKSLEKEKKQVKKDNPGTCPKCGAPLIHRSGISKNGRSYNFQGCSAFPLCSYTRNIPDKKSIPVADEDLIEVQDIRF